MNKHSSTYVFRVGGVYRLVVVMAVAMVAAGLGGCSAQTPSPSASPTISGATPSATPTHPAKPVTVPFDPTSGLDVLTCCRVVGVWSGVAVVVLEDMKSGGFGEVFRGIDVTTGEVLWTYDKVPDGQPFRVGAGMVSGGRLAISVGRSDFTSEKPGNYVVIMELRTGDVLSSRFFPEEYTTADSFGTTVDTSFLSYADGVVVTNTIRAVFPEGSASGMWKQDWVMTEGFEDTNLETPLWQVKSEDVNLGYNNGVVSGPEEYWTALVGGRLVPTGSGGYVDIHTGAASVMTWFDGNNYHEYTEAGDRIVDAVKAAVSRADGFAYLNGWNDSEAAAPAWTYAIPAGALIPGVPAIGCSSDDMLIVRTAGVETGEEALSAIGVADGQLIWSIPYSWSESGSWMRCGVISKGDREVVVLANGSEVKLLNGGDGTQLGKFMILGDGGGEITSIEQCGEWLACVYADTLNPPNSFAYADETRQFGPNDKLIVTAVALGGAAPSSPWSVTVPPMTDKPDKVYPTDAGLVIPTQPSPGVYEWLIV